MDGANSVSADTLGNVYIAGYYGSDSICFSNTTLINTGFGDMFLAKYKGAISSPVQITDAKPNGDDISIYPNPASSVITINCTSKITQLVITNVMGQVVHKQSYNSEKVLVNIADLPCGTYIIRVNNTGFDKFIKN